MEEKAPMSWKEIALQRRILSTISFGRDSMIHLYESLCNSGNSQNDSSRYVWLFVCSKSDTPNVLIFHSTKPTLHTTHITIAKLTQADTMQRTQLAQYCCQNASQQGIILQVSPQSNPCHPINSTRPSIPRWRPKDFRSSLVNIHSEFEFPAGRRSFAAHHFTMEGRQLSHFGWWTRPSKMEVYHR